MILVIFKMVCATRQMARIESVSKIFALGLVDRQFRRVEQKFWSQVVDQNPFFTSNLKKSKRFKVSIVYF